jgi:hypothetical protein
MGNRHVDEVLTAEQIASLDALNGLRAELKAMPESEIERRTTLDPSSAALTAGATAKKVAPFRGELIATFGPQAGELLDELPVVALATRQADIEFTMSMPPDDLTEPYAQVRAAHQLLLIDADSLALRGHLDPKRLAPARNVQGYLATVDSVERIVSLLREDWDRLAPHTPLVAAELDRAVVLAKSLSAAVAARDNGVHRAPAAETRIRVLSKLMRRYDALRRMMTYLRWEQDDVDQLVPSLYASRGRRGRSRNDVDPNNRNPALDDDGGPATPVPPSPINGGAPFTS